MKKVVISIITLGIFYYALHPLYIKGYPNTHDAQVLIARIAAYRTAFDDLHFPPRWAGNLNYGYGTPAFIFYYPLPGYLGALISYTGLSYETSYKILIGFTLLISFVTWFLWMRSRVGINPAFISALIYAIAPYALCNLYVRGDLGEALALSVVPLVLYFFDQQKKLFKLHKIIVSGITWGLILLLHNFIGLIFSVIFFFYLLVFSKRLSIQQRVIRTIIISVIALSISCFFWLPALWEQRYISHILFSDTIIYGHFPHLTRLLWSPWGFGPDINKPDGLSPQLGMVLTFFSFYSLIMFIVRKGKEQTFFIFWLCILVLAFLFMHPVSYPVWDRIPILKKIEFPWRFMGLATVAATSLAAYQLRSVRTSVVFTAVVFFTVIFSLPMTRVQSIAPSKPDIWYKQFPATTSFHNEETTVWTIGDFFQFPERQVSVVQGNARIQKISKTSIRQEFTVFADTNATIVLSTQYYPGWKVYIDRKKTSIEFQNQHYPGLISFDIRKGAHHVIAKFEETKVRTIANSITLLGIGVSFLGIILGRGLFAFTSAAERI